MEREEHDNTPLPSLEYKPSTNNPPAQDVPAKKRWLNARMSTFITAILIFVIGVAASTLWALFLARTANQLQTDELAVISTNLALFVGVVGLSFFGLCALWKESSSLVEAYFWISLVYWFLELASIVVLLVVAYPRRDAAAIKSCSEQRGSQQCYDLVTICIALTIAVLALYKLIGIWGFFTLHRYRQELLSRRAQKNPLILRWLRRSSTSSFASIFERTKWWSSSEIPTIKVDPASDDSSVSDYSNPESAGYRSQQFGLPTYPALAPLPQAHLGFNGLNVPSPHNRHQMTL